MSTSITDGQEFQIDILLRGAVKAALKEVGIGKDGAQRVIERGDEFHNAMREAAITALKDLSVADESKNEEVESSYTYPKEYKGPKPIVDQIKAIAKIFGLDSSQALEFAKNLPVLPDGAEGWFAIPSVDALAKKHFPEVTDQSQKYCHAVQLVHAKIADSRSFYNYREGQITPAQLRVHARTSHALDLIAETQKGDILIIAAQLGMRHRGKPVRRACEVFVSDEFGLGAFAVGIMILTHTERLQHYNDLWIDCAGDEFDDPDAGARFDHAPIFYFRGGEVKFGSSKVDDAGDYSGSASGFLPQ